MDFSKRSSQKELLDAENIPTADLYKNLKELAFINTYLGGFSITLAGLETLVTDKNRSYHIVDIGCGGGDNMKAVAAWAKKNQFKITLTGIDMKADAIDYAGNNCLDFPEINFIESDYQLSQFTTPVDVIISSLFCHHLSAQQFDTCIHWMNKHATLGFIINDLERNKIAYYSIKWLTALFSNSYLVKHDAAVSVSRGFKKNEILNHLKNCGIKSFTIKWKWAFRYLVVVSK